MRYVSTRGHEEELNFEEVLLSGLAKDGGLYIPKFYPHVSPKMIESFGELSYQEIAFHIMQLFTGDTFSDSELRSMIDKAYSSFNHEAICPLVQLSKNHFLLELFHGPTLAFKDIAMQIIGQMFHNVLCKKQFKATVVAATSGDTGSAAMAAFRKSDMVDVFVLFPVGKVSEVQRKQMTTMSRPNMHPIAVEGDFDDCQLLVKQMFNDYKFRDKVNLSGVNSINWARVMSQIVYYFSAGVALGAPKRKLNFTVPTGNFGDIFAGYAAKKMGLPIDKLAIATNQNDILHRTLVTGVYSKHGLKETVSPSMDIQVASNFERLLFDLYDGRTESVIDAMNRLNTDNKFALTSKALYNLRKDFLSGTASEEMTLNTMSQTLQDYGELVCPHTAVGLVVANNIRVTESTTPMVTLATAHPGKFPDSVKESTSITPSLPDRFSDLFFKDEKYVSVGSQFNEIKEIISERTSA